MKKLLFALGLLLIIFAPAQQPTLAADDSIGKCACNYLSVTDDKTACAKEGCKWDATCVCTKEFSNMTAITCTAKEQELNGACTFTADAVQPSDPGTGQPVDTGGKQPLDAGAKSTGPKAAPTSSGSTYELPNFLGITDPNVLINRIIKAVIGVTGSAALVIFIYGGFLWLTSMGDEKKVKDGTNAMKWATIGLFVIFSSYVLINFILNSLNKTGS
jgi:hypothetical protein